MSHCRSLLVEYRKLLHELNANILAPIGDTPNRWHHTMPILSNTTSEVRMYFNDPAYCLKLLGDLDS